MKHTPEPWKIGYREEIKGDYLEPDERGCYVGIDSTKTGWTGLAAVVVRMEDDEHDHAEGLANAERIVACVNYCAGTPTELLNCTSDQAVRAGSNAMSADRLLFMRQRDSLLKAITDFLEMPDSDGSQEASRIRRDIKRELSRVVRECRS